MSVANLLNQPKDNASWASWSFDHRVSHERIIQAILVKANLILTEYVLEPIIDSDITGFLQRNQQMHLDMNGVLGLQSGDIQDVDFRNPGQFATWTETHWLEHDAAERALGI